MFLGTCTKTVILAFSCFTLAICEIESDGNDWQDDRLVLSASELVNLVRRELGLVASVFKGTQKGSSAQEQKCTTTKKQMSNDEDTLKDRKVWSRWSKWSKCSNICGAGTMTRRRLCVAGRCAPGEKEEQHRACEGTPCVGQEVTSSTAAARIEVPTDADPDPDAME